MDVRPNIPCLTSRFILTRPRWTIQWDHGPCHHGYPDPHHPPLTRRFHPWHGLFPSRPSLHPNHHQSVTRKAYGGGYLQPTRTDSSLKQQLDEQRQLWSSPVPTCQDTQRGRVLRSIAQDLQTTRGAPAGDSGKKRTHTPKRCPCPSFSSQN